MISFCWKIFSYFILMAVRCDGRKPAANQKYDDAVVITAVDKMKAHTGGYELCPAVT